MNKWIKRVAGGIGGLIVLGAAGVAVRFYGLAPALRPAPAVQAPTTPAAIERGKYLATNVAVCVNCHSDASEITPGQPVAANAKIGAGRALTKYKQFPTKTGGAFSPNLTPSKQHGLGNWSDGEVLRAIREGVDRDNRALFHVMPYFSFKSMSDDDALSVVAYLRSLQPVEVPSPGKLQLIFPVSMLARSIPRPIEKPVPPPANDPVSRGNYLLTIALCHQCHDGLNKLHMPVPGKELSGGFPMHFPRGTIYPANITSDPETGIGSYSDEDLKRAITKGISKSGKTIYLMPFSAYQGMTDGDISDIIAALRASKPIKNVVPAAELHEPPADSGH